MFDIWNDHVDIAEKVYQKENYIIKANYDCHNGVCYIFFSSNNIWFPNTEESFRRSFIDNDYYEWRNFGKLPAEKFIFVRDIYKSWYVTGINSRLDSVDTVIDFLRKETIGMRVITVGSSAGGYMAALMAACLNAEYSICFSGYFDLTVKGALGVNPFLKKFRQDPNKNRYYQISDIIKNSRIDIFYILPAYSDLDLEQLSRVTEIDNVHIIKIASHHHGVPLLTGNLDKLLRMSKEDLMYLFAENRNRIVGVISMSVRLSGIMGTCSCVQKDVCKVLKKFMRR